MQPMSHRSHQGFLLEDWRVPSRQVYDQATFLPGTPSMSRPMRRLLCAGLLLLIPGLSLAADNAAAAGPQPPVTDRSLAESTCVIGEEAFVPGDYYYCLAGQSYGEKNYGQSRRFFTTAAGWASKPAQFMLGLMAFNGDQQAVNRPLGLAWLALAAERGQPRFSSALAAARTKASAADWAAAQDILAQLQPTYGDAKAAPRAEERYRLGMQKLRQTEANAGSYCMAGMVPMSQLSNRSEGASSAMASHCPPVEQVVQAIDHSADALFDGWNGHVEVGPLQQIKARSGGN